MSKIASNGRTGLKRLQYDYYHFGNRDKRSLHLTCFGCVHSEDRSYGNSCRPCNRDTGSDEKHYEELKRMDRLMPKYDDSARRVRGVNPKVQPRLSASSCSLGHTGIIYSVAECPLCAVLARTIELEKEEIQRAAAGQETSSGLGRLIASYISLSIPHPLHATCFGCRLEGSDCEHECGTEESHNLNTRNAADHYDNLKSNGLLYHEYAEGNDEK